MACLVSTASASAQAVCFEEPLEVHGPNALQLRGLVLMATPGRPFGELLREQLRANPANAPGLDLAPGTVDAITRFIEVRPARWRGHAGLRAQADAA
ncbi:MAG: hypothetical protein J0H69_08120 [Burkholderiales bacterium]|nr:hypothetical protein [Burkholderiales bacterium]